MKNIMQNLWLDTDGFIISGELVLVGTILVIGMLVGLVTVRDQVVQELAETFTQHGLLFGVFDWPQLERLYWLTFHPFRGLFTIWGTGFSPMARRKVRIPTRLINSPILSRILPFSSHQSMMRVIRSFSSS